MDRPPVHELSAVNGHSLRFKYRATVNVEGEGNRDGVIDLIGCGAFPEKGTESARTG